MKLLQNIITKYKKCYEILKITRNVKNIMKFILLQNIYLSNI